MFCFDKSGRMYLYGQQPKEWLLYFLFAYLHHPPTDETFEHFENAHDRAVRGYRDPDQLIEHLRKLDLSKAGAAKADLNMKKWKRFLERHQNKTEKEILQVIAFFMNERLSRCPVRPFHAEAA